MNFCSYEAIACIGGAVLLFQLLPFRWLRHVWLTVLNGAFLFSLSPSENAVAILAGFVLLSYMVIQFSRICTSLTFIAIAITLATVAFSFLKSYSPYVVISAGVIGLLGVLLSIGQSRPRSAWLLLCLTVGGGVALILFRLEVIGHSQRFFQRLAGSGSLLSRISEWSAVELVGLSYMFFKFIHVFIDRWQGQLDRVRFHVYVNYQFSFFTLVAGPIQRFGDFERFWDSVGAPVPSPNTTLYGWSRVFTGMLKMGVLAPFVQEYFQAASDAAMAPDSPNLAANFVQMFYSYPIYLYLNFSGYTDLVIGCARLFGLILPENFNYPFLGRNVIDFWDRWHMSLTRWIRDYIFMTSYKAIVERYPSFVRLMGPLLMFVSLFVAGIWHGAAARYIVFGAVFGLGAVVGHAYGDILRARLGRTGFKAYQQNILIRSLAVLLTFHFVCFAFLFFSSGVGDIVEVLAKLRARVDFSQLTPVLSWITVSRATAILAAGTVGILWLRYGPQSRIAQALKRATSHPVGLYGIVVGQVVLLVAFFIGTLAFEKQVEPTGVVYRRF